MTNRFTKSLLRQRRFQAAWLGWTFFCLSLTTAYLGWQILATDKVNLASEWGVLPLLVLPWAFAIHFLIRHFRPANSLYRGDAAIVESVRSARDAIRNKRRNLKMIGVLFLIFVPVLALSISQLHTAGKLETHEMISMVVFMAGVLGLSALGLFLKRRHLGAQQMKLDTVLAQFELSEV